MIGRKTSLQPGSQGETLKSPAKGTHETSGAVVQGLVHVVVELADELRDVLAVVSAAAAAAALREADMGVDI